MMHKVGEPPAIGPGAPDPGGGPVQCVHELDPATGKCKHCGGFWRDLNYGFGEAIGEAKFGE